MEEILKFVSIYIKMSYRNLVFLLSGGHLNQLTENSIGGSPSTFKIEGGLNNLFTNISIEQQQEGLQDFRCFYIKNTGHDIIKNFKMWIGKEKNGARINIGTDLQSDVQTLFVKKDNPHGSFFLTYTTKRNKVTVEEKTKDIRWNQDVHIVSKEIRAELNKLIGLSDVICEAESSDEGHLFAIIFPKGRKQLPLKVNGNLTSNIEITHLLTGGPINTIAPNIGNSNTPPIRVEFSDYTEDTPLSLGNLLPTDILPIWIRRIFDSTSQIKSNPDKFIINISGEIVSGALIKSNN
jgi:hypothetical protein